MTTLFNRKVLALAALAVGLAATSMVQAAGNKYEAYNAYEELSGTHPTNQWARESIDAPKASARVSTYASYDAYEELSGTHAAAKTARTGMAGSTGEIGEPGKAGSQRGGVFTQFDISGDVAGGCAQYLRCSGY
jgi:hypothetical protein